MALARCAGLLALLGIAGCAQAFTDNGAPGAPAPAAAHSLPTVAGTILSMRAVAVRGERDPLRVALLADAGGGPTAVADGSSQLTEFIVRIDGGSTISVMQTNEPGFRPGDRVTILRDGRTHIARPG
jgi:outer membrane lipoprotein SlyB